MSLRILSSIQERKHPHHFFEQVITPFDIYKLAKKRGKKCCLPLSNKHKRISCIHCPTLVITASYY